MKTFQIYLPADPRLAEMVAEKRSWDWDTKRDYNDFKEDYLLESNNHPIFTVGDGVTLSISPGQKYPLPSGAGEVAKIFCKESISQAEKNYSSFGKGDILKIFKKANTVVGEYNKKQGRIKKRINYWDVDYFSATGAFALVKEDKFYWGSICDSQIAHFDKSGKLKFISDDGWSYFNEHKPENWGKMEIKEKTVYMHKIMRNNVNKNKLTGYGVINGENNALKYVNSGSLDIHTGDFFLVFTDGFAPYMKEKFFIDLFRKWPNNFKKELETKINEFIKKNEPKNKKELYKFLYNYSSERSLIAILFN